jgi:hypothetical protein
MPASAVVQVDHVAVAMALGLMPVRVAVRLRAFPALVLVPMMLVVDVQMLVVESRMLMLELLGIGWRPEPHPDAARHDHQQAEHAEGPKTGRSRYQPRRRRGT